MYMYVRGSSANKGEGIIAIGARGAILRRAILRRAEVGQNLY
jgi:hypothetical protein